MSADQLEQGKLIVEAMVRQEAEGLGLPLTSVRWLPHAGDDFARGLYSLECIANGKRVVEGFAEEDLCDAANAGSAPARLAGQVTSLLQEAL